MIRLFISCYPEGNSDRLQELTLALERNLVLLEIDAICVFLEGVDSPWIDSPRLNTRAITHRPSYCDFFGWANELVSSANDISLIANSDIALDDNLRMLTRFSWPEKTVMALSRWDVLADGTSQIFEHGDSQDCWLFRGRIPEVPGNFPLGVYDCDNKIAWELQQAGYQVINPAFSIRTWHHHQSGFRSYEEKPAPDYGIRPPFLYVEPDNLWGLFKAWAVKRQLKLDYLPWRMTTKRFWRYPVPALMKRAWNKGLRILRNRHQ